MPVRPLALVTLMLSLAAFAKTTAWHGDALGDMDGAKAIDRAAHAPMPKVSGVLHIFAAELEAETALRDSVSWRPWSCRRAE